VYELQSGDPQRIGPYWLEARLGSGGMGRVYLGRSPGGRHVAIKVIRPELAEDAEFRARFAREVAAARKVSGIFTAQVVDADTGGPVPWLATSYVAGSSLADVVANRGPLPAATVLALAAGLAEGLAAIHAAGVVHRDLKPSNVLLAEDGPRLIDFGISRSMEASPLTGTGMVVGSPGFMSPEQAQGREVGPPSDIFSLGAVLAFAATGEGPFGEGSTVSLLYRVVTSDPDTARLPAEIGPLIARCLVKDPWRRPTAVQLLAELSTVPPATQVQRGPDGAAGAAGAAHPATERAMPPTLPPASPPGWPPTVTTPDPRPGYGGLVAPPGPGYGGQVAPPGPGYGGPAGRRRPRRSGRGWLLAAVAVVVLAVAGAGAFVATRAGHRGTPASFSTTSSVRPSPTAAGTSPGPSPANQPPGAAAMSAIGSDLSRSASVRPTVQLAINGVDNCSESPSSGEATLQQAIDTRQAILTDLQTLSVSGLPNGPQLVSTLTTAMQQSVAADQDFKAWMADFANAGNPCGSDPGRNSNYLAGQNASVAASSAKNSFLATWNPMAPGYGQRTYSESEF
jgi:hypothetical protein